MSPDHPTPLSSQPPLTPPGRLLPGHPRLYTRGRLPRRAFPRGPLLGPRLAGPAPRRRPPPAPHAGPGEDAGPAPALHLRPPAPPLAAAAAARSGAAPAALPGPLPAPGQPVPSPPCCPTRGKPPRSSPLLPGPPRPAGAGSPLGSAPLASGPRFPLAGRRRRRRRQAEVKAVALQPPKASRGRGPRRASAGGSAVAVCRTVASAPVCFPLRPGCAGRRLRTGPGEARRDTGGRERCRDGGLPPGGARCPAPPPAALAPLPRVCAGALLAPPVAPAGAGVTCGDARGPARGGFPPRRRGWKRVQELGGGGGARPGPGSLRGDRWSASVRGGLRGGDGCCGTLIYAGWCFSNGIDIKLFCSLSLLVQASTF